MTAAPTSAEPAGVGRLLPGVLLCVALAAGAMALAEVPWVRGSLRWSPLLLVVLLGMAWRSALPVPTAAEPGVRLAQRPLLRWAVAGLGLRLSLHDLVDIGVPALAVVVVGTAAALVVGAWVARRLGVAEDLALLLGVGGAVCGASAVVAADTVVQAERRHAALAVGVITLLGTAGIFVYPVVAHAAGLDHRLYGVWSGASLHETAQVVAAAGAVSEDAQAVATVAKLVRIALLAPIVLLLAAWLRRRRPDVGRARVAPLPWFLVLFVAFAALRSTGAIPSGTVAAADRVVVALLTVGMAGVGLQTGFSDLRAAGGRAIAAGVVQWAFLAGLTLALCVALLG